MSQNEECCPKFNPEKWNGKVIEWKVKKFIQDKVFTIFYIPLNFGLVMTKISKLIDASSATMEEGLCLADSSSLWNMNVFAAVNKEVKGAQNVTLSGKYLVKVFEGEFKDTSVWMKSFEKFAEEKDYAISKTYAWYTTCPKCAKKYGHNYVAIFGKII